MAKSYIKLWDSYDSYFEPLGAAEVGRLVLAMMKYKSSGVEPEFSGSEKFIWPAIKRDLDEDASYTEKKSSSGRIGGKSTKSEAKQTEANASTLKQTQAGLRTKDVGLRTKDKEISPDGDTEKAADVDADLAQIVQHYEQAVGSFPRSALDKLQTWRQSCSAEMILLAIDKAAEAGKRSWSYINGILSGWQRDGLRTPGDVAAADARRATQKANAPRNKAMMASRPPEEAANARNFLANAAHRRPLKKKGEHHATIQSDP